MTATSTNAARSIARRVLAGADDVLDCVVALNGGYARPDHLRDIAEFWASVARGKPTRLVLSSAPRFGKSVTNTVGAAWAMFCRPGTRIVLVSATQDLADELSRIIRTYAEHIGLVVAKDQRSVSRWVATNGSECRSYGVDSSLIGVAADVLIADDLLPSMASANSPTEREKVDTFFRGQAIARMQPGASAIVTFHRWSIDDQIQTLIDRGWPHVNVPACDFITGESTFPAFWSTAQLREKERDVGPLLWQAQYQGCPQPRGGAVFVGPPTTYSMLEMRRMLGAREGRVMIACDPAATARTRADFSVIMVGLFHGYGLDQKLDIIGVQRMQVELPDLIERLFTTQRHWGGAPVAVEANGVGAAVPQFLRRAGAGRVLALKSTTDKLTRAMPAAAAWSRGCIRWPDVGAHWLPGVLREVAAFTGTGAEPHDDVPDALVHLFLAGAGAAHADLVARRRISILNSLPFG